MKSDFKFSMLLCKLYTRMRLIQFHLVALEMIFAKRKHAGVSERYVTSLLE